MGCMPAASTRSETKLVVASAARGVYAAGTLLWAIEERLVAQPFDPAGGRLSGEAVTLVPAVYQGAGRTPAFWASENALVYAVGGSRERQFRWFDRAGTALQTVGPPGLYGGFDLSPDGSRLAIEVLKDGPDDALDHLDARHGARCVRAAHDAVISTTTILASAPAGDIAFARNTGDSTGIVRVDATGANPTVLLPRGKRAGHLAGRPGRSMAPLSFERAADRDAWQLNPRRRRTPGG